LQKQTGDQLFLSQIKTDLKMKNITSLNYFNKIKLLVPCKKFIKIESRLIDESNLHLEAFYNIIIAGYPLDFALANYVNLGEYINNNKHIEYEQALTTYATYPGLKDGIYITKTKWFELN